MNAINELTKQEWTVLALVAKGWRTAKIAQELFISPRTVETHLSHIFHKLGVSSRTEAALYVFHVNWTRNLEVSRNPEDGLDNTPYAYRYEVREAT